MQVYVFQHGSVTPLPNAATWEAQFDFKFHYHATDKDANKLFSACKPDVIISIAEKSESFSCLFRMPNYICQRWLNFTKPADIQFYHIQNCFLHALEVQTGPKISIFTTCYKSMEKIKRPSESLKAQTLRDWEWVILDDSPDDMTWNAFLVPLAEKDCRIRIYRGKCNDGFIGSVKRDAASMCRSEYFVELDHDDELCENALELIFNTFEAHPEVGLIGTDCTEPYENNLSDVCYGDYYGMGFHSYYKLWYQNRWVSVARNGPLNQFTLGHIVGVYNHARAVRRKAYHDVSGGHDHRLYVADDYDLIVRMFCSKWRLAKLPVFLYKQYRYNDGDNFTNYRNHYIQILVEMLRTMHMDAIKKKLQEMKLPNDIYPNNYQSPPKVAFEDWTHHPAADLVLNPASDAIAIVMPTFNRKKLLCRAVKSVLAQDFTNWVLYIIGDKCPTLDATMSEKGYMHDPRIRYWNLADNRKSGIYPRNYALHTLVTEDRVAYLDDDNVWKKNHLSSLHKAITTQLSKDGRKPRFAFSSFVFEEKGVDKVRVKCSEPKLYRIDTSTLLHDVTLLHQYRYWRPESVCGYAVDWDLVQPWVASDEPWVATKLFTLRYNNTKQDMEGIRNAYPDQDDDDKNEDEPEVEEITARIAESKINSDTTQHQVVIPLAAAMENPNFCPECMCVHNDNHGGVDAQVTFEEPCVISIHPVEPDDEPELTNNDNNRNPDDEPEATNNDNDGNPDIDDVINFLHDDTAESNE